MLVREFDLFLLERIILKPGKVRVDAAPCQSLQVAFILLSKHQELEKACRGQRLGRSPVQHALLCLFVFNVFKTGDAGQMWSGSLSPHARHKSFYSIPYR